MIKYLIAIILLFYILFTIYFRIRYKFWSKQPVFHLHNIRYWLFPPGIIQHTPPKLGKFFDRLIKTKKYCQLSKKEKYDMHQLIFSYYLDEKDVNYKPTKKSIFKYLQNHDEQAFISLFFKKKPFFDVTNKQNIVTNKLVSVITSRPLNCFINKNKLVLNYVDYLCVHKNYRKKGIAPKIIFTHQARVRNNSKNTVFLFKRETDLTSIVPLSNFYTYGFDTKYWKYGSKPISKYSHILLTSQNIHIFYHLIEKIKEDKSCIIYPSLSNLNTLIKNNLLIIYILLEKDKPLACYIFRKPFTGYIIEDKKGDSIDCVGSYFDKTLNFQIFIYYFYFSLFLLQKKQHFKYFIIENICDNNYIIQNIFKKYAPIIKTPMAYYFYNFAYRPKLSNNIFILN
jgi:hypothetical protein